MKKKIKDLTGVEYDAFCKTQKSCVGCPLKTPRPVNEKTEKEYLEREVEI